MMCYVNVFYDVPLLILLIVLVMVMFVSSDHEWREGFDKLNNDRFVNEGYNDPKQGDQTKHTSY